MQFLSAAWLAALDDTARTLAPPQWPAPPAPLVLEQVVHGDDAGDGDVVWHLVLEASGARVHPGAADSPTVRLSCDRPTAEAIWRGSMSAPNAFMAGVLRVGGDPTALTEARASLEVLASALAEVTDDSDPGDGAGPDAGTTTDP